jgi:hypothetical protein
VNLRGQSVTATLLLRQGLSRGMQQHSAGRSSVTPGLNTALNDPQLVCRQIADEGALSGRPLPLQLIDSAHEGCLLSRTKRWEVGCRDVPLYRTSLCLLASSRCRPWILGDLRCSFACPTGCFGHDLV